jgi:type II secretory pathway pseudopilin PulG
MPAKRTAIFNQGQGQQRGAVLMIMLVIMVMGIAAVLISSLSTTALKNARQETTSNALAQAKDALIGYAVSDPNRPGELPCPDFDNDGMITLADYSGSNCKSLIGRLPWKTLGLPDLRDGSGEHLWYAISDTFHANGSTIINSNTKGTLLVYNTDGVSLQTQAGYNAVAVIFSPGSALGSQTRNTVAQQNSAANYLDIANGQNNSSASGPFIAGTQSATFNDQFLYITTKDLIPLVEQRVAGEVKRALTDYYTANGYYPWADSVAQSADYNSNEGLNRGWLPYLSSTPSSPAEWCCTSFPAWFYNNEWYKLIYYSVAEYYTPNRFDFGCSTCKLTVDSTNGVRVLFFMPGTPIGTLTRSLTSLPDYLEDTANNDDSNDLYVTPTSQALDRDRLYWLPSSSIWNQ